MQIFCEIWYFNIDWFNLTINFIIWISRITNKANNLSEYKMRSILINPHIFVEQLNE